jgi:hypothetical protein
MPLNASLHFKPRSETVPPFSKKGEFMPRPETMRGNTWTLTLKLEDAADLAGYIADPNDGWPLIEDPAVILAALRKSFRGMAIDLPTGGRLNIVDLDLDPPEKEEFLTERTFRNRMEGERQAAILRTEWPQDAPAALEMVLSAWEYVWRTHTGDRSGRSELQEAAYEIQDAAGIREEARDIEARVGHKWTARERLGMLDRKGNTR